MKKTCPNCGKELDVSLEEVTMREGVVVCPQCLSVFDMDGNTRDNDEPQGEVRKPQGQPASEAGDTFSFCPECGHSLPAGVNFCPYCGTKLSQLRRAQATAATVNAPEPQAGGAETAKVPDETQPEATPQRRSASKPTMMVTNPQVGHRKWGTGEASTRARAAGYTAIVMLLGLLVYIIYQATLVMAGN